MVLEANSEIEHHFRTLDRFDRQSGLASVIFQIINKRGGQNGTSGSFNDQKVKFLTRRADFSGL